MEKRADAADASVLIFLLAVLICWLYTRKLAKKELCCLKVNFSLDTLPKMIMIHLWHVPSGHIDEGYEGEGDEDVAS